MPNPSKTDGADVPFVADHELKSQLGAGVRFDDYQERIEAATPNADPLVTLLGLGAHTGALLEAHHRYLGDGIDANVSTSLVRLELGAVLSHIAVLASTYGLSLDEVARSNIDKIRKRAQLLHMSQVPEVPTGPIEAAVYQRLAAQTDQYAKVGLDPLALAVPMLGLAGEAGTLLVEQKKLYRDKPGESPDPSFIAVELGDVLWYASTVALHARIELDDLLRSSAESAARRQSEYALLHDLPSDLPVLDNDYPNTEQFPRRLLIRVQEERSGSRALARLTLVQAEPNAFAMGPIDIGRESAQGFTIGGPLGSPLTDNSRRADDYRFHDAIHLGFLAVMGWSPNMRSLLHLKRRSDDAADENEDGARAIFAEEGMAAVLAKRAPQRQGFLTEVSVDDESIEMLTTVFEDLEVSKMPSWLWRRAITQGFQAMRCLAEGPGGFLVVDLDSRLLTYRKTPLAGHC